jgi:hypothetical protein
MSEKLTHSIKGAVEGEPVTFTPVFHDRRSEPSGSPAISVGHERLPDGRRAVGVQGYTVKGARTPAGESIVAIPKSVLLEGAARVVAHDIVSFTKVASDVVGFTRTAMNNIRRVRAEGTSRRKA